MNQVRFLLLTALIMVSASRLPGQPPSLGQGSQWGLPAVCNDGTITFSVAHASRRYKDFFDGSDQWNIQGWFNVEPGKCTRIGDGVVYRGGGLAGEDSVTLLAFAFYDSKRVWRGIKVQNEDHGWFYPMYPPNQQICVGPKEAGFGYTRNSPKQIDLARECDRAAPGYSLIPASFIYKGSGRVPPDGSPDYLHVKIGADDRAITSGIGSRWATAAPGVDAGQSSPDASGSLCGKVSCWDIFLQKLNEAGAQRSAASNNNPTPPRPSTNPPSPPPRPATQPPPLDDDDPIGNAGGITPPSSPAPASDRANSLQWVRADMLAYVEASKTGFAAYKKGAPQISQDYRMWDSPVKPSAARGCWVVQGATATTLSCALSERGDLNGLRPYYTELNKEIATTLPRDWTALVEPPFGGDTPNQGYRSSSGAHLEVWIAAAESGGGYEIHFQLVSAH